MQAPKEAVRDLFHLLMVLRGGKLRGAHSMHCLGNRVEALHTVQMGNLAETFKILGSIEAMSSRRPLWTDQSLAFP